MKIGWFGAAMIVAVILVAGPALAFADDATKAVDKESSGIFTSILRILIRWIFPLGAAYFLVPALSFVAVQLVSHAASLPFQSAMPRPAGGNPAQAAGQAAGRAAAVLAE